MGTLYIYDHPLILHKLSIFRAVVEKVDSNVFPGMSQKAQKNTSK